MISCLLKPPWNLLSCSKKNILVQLSQKIAGCLIQMTPRSATPHQMVGDQDLISSLSNFTEKPIRNIRGWSQFLHLPYKMIVRTSKCLSTSVPISISESWHGMDEYHLAGGVNKYCISDWCPHAIPPNTGWTRIRKTNIYQLATKAYWRLLTCVPWLM